MEERIYEVKGVWTIKNPRGIDYAQFNILKFVEEKLRKAIAEKEKEEV